MAETFCRQEWKKSFTICCMLCFFCSDIVQVSFSETTIWHCLMNDEQGKLIDKSRTFS